MCPQNAPTEINSEAFPRDIVSRRCTTVIHGSGARDIAANRKLFRATNITICVFIIHLFNSHFSWCSRLRFAWLWMCTLFSKLANILVVCWWHRHPARSQLRHFIFNVCETRRQLTFRTLLLIERIWMGERDRRRSGGESGTKSTNDKLEWMRYLVSLWTAVWNTFSMHETAATFISANTHGLHGKYSQCEGENENSEHLFMCKKFELLVYSVKEKSHFTWSWAYILQRPFLPVSHFEWYIHVE